MSCDSPGRGRWHAAGNPDAACDSGARVQSPRRRVQFGRGRYEWYHLGSSGILKNPETFHSSKHKQTTSPFSACERSRPLTHTPAPSMYPSLPYPLANPTSPTTTLFSPPSPTAPPQLCHPNVQNSRTWPSPARATGHGQGLWAAARDRSAGGFSAGGKWEDDGGGTRRGGQGVGDLVPRSQRQSKGKRWVKWDRGGGGGEGDGGREQD